MAAASALPKRLLIVGLPRSGTTLVATLLAAQPNVCFLTDYFPAFTAALEQLRKRWDEPLELGERRIALALVRDQFLRVRHPVLVKQEQFSTLDQLHVAVLAELRREHDALVGHKLLMSATQLAAALEHGGCHCLLLYRDPRDATLSFFHRTGGGVESYVRNWCELLAFVGARPQHPRLLALKFEDLILEPRATLDKLGSWLGLSLSADVHEFGFQRSRAHGNTPWQENSAFADVRQRFDKQPLGRWKNELTSPIVRYAGWATAAALPGLGYEPLPEGALSAADRARFTCLRALERGEHHAYASTARLLRDARHHLWR